MDLLTGSIGVQCGVEGVAFLLAVGDLSATLDGVSGRGAIVGIGNSFPFIAGVNWKVLFSSIWVLESI